MIIQQCTKEQQLIVRSVKDPFSHYQQKYEDDKKINVTVLKIVNSSQFHLFTYFHTIDVSSLCSWNTDFSDRLGTKGCRSAMMPADT